MILALLLAIQTAAPPTPVVLETPEGAREPQLAISGKRDRDRTVCATFGTKNGVYVARSTDDGKSFGPPVLVADVESLALGMRRGPRVAIPLDSVVVTAIAGEKGGGRDGDLLCWRSADAGKTWQTGARINSAAGSAREGLHAMAQDPYGRRLCTVWIDLETGSPRILGSFSPDGATWGTPFVVEGDSNSICPCCTPSVSFGVDGDVVVMWRSQSEGTRDLVISASSDSGKLFTRPRKVSQATWKIASCPMDGGAIDWKFGTPCIALQREGKVYYSLGDLDSLLGEGEQPWITSSRPEKSGLRVVYLKKRGGPLVLWKFRNDGPVTLDLDSVANDPVVVSAENTYLETLVLAAWESGDVANPKLVVARIEEDAAKK